MTDCAAHELSALRKVHNLSQIQDHLEKLEQEISEVHSLIQTTQQDIEDNEKEIMKVIEN